MSAKGKNTLWIKDGLKAAVLPFCIVFVYALSQYFNFRFTSIGIRPRSFDGVLGIALFPLAHGSWDHVFSNIVPLWVLSFYILQNYRSVFYQVLIYGTLLGGAWTWVSARPSVHIGASGLVYALFGFLFLSGILNRNKRTIGTTMLVVFLYGGLIWGIFPEDKRISYEGHFWGLVAGLILAWYYRARFKVTRNRAKEGVLNDVYMNRAERLFGKYYWDKEKREAWLKEQEALQAELDKQSERNTDNSSNSGGYTIQYHIKKDDNRK